MLKETISGISEALAEKFGGDYPIYTEEIAESLQNHCFVIKCLTYSQALRVGTRYETKQAFDIRYYPGSEDAYGDISDLVEKTCECLEYISISNQLVRGSSLKCDLEERPIHFLVNYDYFYVKKELTDMTMEVLEVQTKERM